MSASVQRHDNDRLAEHYRSVSVYQKWFDCVHGNSVLFLYESSTKSCNNKIILKSIMLLFWEHVVLFRFLDLSVSPNGQPGNRCCRAVRYFWSSESFHLWHENYCVQNSSSCYVTEQFILRRTVNASQHQAELSSLCEWTCFTADKNRNPLLISTHKTGSRRLIQICNLHQSVSWGQEIQTPTVHAAGGGRRKQLISDPDVNRRDGAQCEIWSEPAEAREM